MTHSMTIQFKLVVSNNNYERVNCRNYDNHERISNEPAVPHHEDTSLIDRSGVAVPYVSDSPREVIDEVRQGEDDVSERVEDDGDGGV